MCAKERGLDTESHIESERVSRRTALKRLGITAGMAMFSLLTVDDLARVALNKLKDNKICNDLADEFKNTGMAIAQTTSGDCMKQCKQAYDDCILMCDCPEGCNCAGGTLWPRCWAYNFCIGPFGACVQNRTTCYQDCVANGEG